MDCSTPGFPIHHQFLEIAQTCPLSQWWHPTISSSVVPLSSHLQSFPASGSFQMSQFITSSGQSIGVSAPALVLPMDIQDWFHWRRKSRLISSWRRLPLVPPWSHWADNTQTAEQLYQRISHTVTKVLGPTIDFPTWGSGKGTDNPQRIWLWRPVGFDYRTSTGQGNRLWEGTNKPLCTPGPRRKEQWFHKRLSQACLWVSRSLWKRHGSTEAFHQKGALNTTVLA